MTNRSRALFLALVLTLCAGHVAPAATIDGVQYLSDTKHYYKVYTDNRSWASAKKAAEDLGGYLAVVTSTAENNFLSATLGARDKWLGATDEVTEGTWLWVNGETWSFTAWNSGEPNNVGGEHYLSFNTSGTWNDLPASYSVGYIVEWDRNPNITDPPEAPTALAGTATTETRVDLTWTDNSAIELAFEVERSIGSGSFGPLAKLGENSTSYADTSVLPGGDYSYRVRATNDIGPSAWTSTVSVTTSTPPVSGLKASVLSNRTIELTWKDDSPDDAEIAVERGSGATPATWSRIAKLAGDATSHVNSTVAPDTTYSYRLQPLRAFGGFAPSGAVTIRTSPTDPVPGQPVVRDGTKVELVWQDLSDGETSYEVERGIGWPGRDFKLLAVLAADKTSYKDSTAEPETTYSYRVRAIGPTGPSAWTPEMRVTTPPFGPAAFDAAVVSTTRAELSWGDVSKIEDGYHVDRQTAPDDRWERLADLPAGSTSYADASARQDARYAYRIAAFDENGDSAWAESPQVATPAAMVIDRVSISRPKGKSTKPAKLQATGSFDAGAAAFTVLVPAEVRIGGTSVTLTTRRDIKGGVQLDGSVEGGLATLVLKPSKTGSSRVAFTLTATGTPAGATAAGATLRVWYVQTGFSTAGAITLAGDRFVAGGTGALVDPPLALDAVAGSLTAGAKDKLQMRCRFAAGPVPDAQPDVSLQIGALTFTAKGAEFKRQGDKLVYSQKLFGGRKITLDYRTGIATFVIGGAELGAFTSDSASGAIQVTIGDLSFSDVPVLRVTTKSVGY